MTSIEKWLIGCDGSGVCLAPRGHLSAQNQAFIVGEGAPRAPFKSDAHSPLCLTCRWELTQLKASSQSTPSFSPPSLLFLPPASPFYPYPSIYRSLLTGAFLHFLHTCSQLAAFILEGKFAPSFFRQNPFHAFYFVLSGFASPSFSTSSFSSTFFFPCPPSIPCPPSSSAIPIYL